MGRFGVALLVLFAFVSTQGLATQAPADPSSPWTGEPEKFVCADQRPGGGTDSLSEKNYVLTRLESGTLSGAADRAITINSDPGNKITIVGKAQREFSMQYCGRGVGSSEAEARERLREVSMTLGADIVSLNSLGPEGRLPPGSFLLDAPANATAVIHALSSTVEVRNMSGPVWVSAGRAQAIILNTTGTVDAEADTIAFAGSRGRVLLSAKDIELAMTTKFDGTIYAWGNKSIRMQVPAGFQTPFTARIGPGGEFVCRADICSQIKKTGEGYVYSGDGKTPPKNLYLVSGPHSFVPDYPSKIVIENLSDATAKILESDPTAPKR
ncbi:MAG TPA: hypothetical protein VFY29_01005 [Terriglobia bacterium]|nr:hypothetical protein [Terriglobia bacterium]